MYSPEDVTELNLMQDYYGSFYIDICTYEGEQHMYLGRESLKALRDEITRLLGEEESEGSDNA